MNFIQAKYKTPLIITIAVVIVLFVAGTSYLIMNTMNLGKKTQEQSKTTKTPEKVSPEQLKASLKETNDSISKEAADHKNAKEAVNEAQVKLVN